MSSTSLRISIGLVVWGGCLAGSLAIANFPGQLGHSLCGPWGCGPPLQALFACHAAWLVALLTPAGVLIRWRRISHSTQRRAGIVLVLLGVTFLATLLTQQWLVWWPQAGQWQRPYFWQRYGFVVATTVDVPMVRLLLIGLAIWLSARTSRRNR